MIQACHAGVKEDEEVRRSEEVDCAAKNKNPTFRMWGINKSLSLFLSIHIYIGMNARSGDVNTILIRLRKAGTSSTSTSTSASASASNNNNNNNNNRNNSSSSSSVNIQGNIARLRDSPFFDWEHLFGTMVRVQCS